MVLRLNFSNILILVLLLSAALTAWADQPLTGEGPIVITADTLVADKKANTARFEGAVVAKSEDLTLKADSMDVTYGNGGRIDRIVAEGNVTLLKNNQVVTSGNAVYMAEEGKIVFTGSPKAVEGGNVVTGTEMTYLTREDRFIVKGSRVLLEPATEGEGAGGDR
jgi:lipopolysaccharide export system protein LptA